MGVKHIWDTNIAIYYLQQQFPEKAERFIDNTLKKALPCISAITEIELLCWKAATEKDLEAIQLFINDIIVIELEHEIKLRTANIRKQYKIKLPDAIIAATAIVHDLTLITRNVTTSKR
ncbi:MAG: type II toxin-antitoxin system VapC family toxin [Flavobacteriales bacterium]|nr:type II toxin-antitoxin system VapC family toxin [Flavobacteriales bacterium]